MTTRTILFGLLLTVMVTGTGIHGQAPQAAPPQQPPITFRAEINYVEVVSSGPTSRPVTFRCSKTASHRG